MRVMLICFMVLALALAGCGKKEDTGLGGETFKTPDKEEGAYLITIDSTSISPRNAKVPEAAVVKWYVESGSCWIKANDGAFDSKNGSGGVSYNNGQVSSGETFTWTAITPGEHEYGCNGKDIKGVLKVS